MKKLFAALIAALTILTSGCTARLDSSEEKSSVTAPVSTEETAPCKTGETQDSSPLPAPSDEQIAANAEKIADFPANDKGIKGETLTVFEAEPYSFEEAYEKAEEVKQILKTHGFVYSSIRLRAGAAAQAKENYLNKGIIDYYSNSETVLTFNKWGSTTVNFGYGENYPDIAALTGKKDPSPEDKKTLVKAAKEMLKCYFPQRSELNRLWSDVKTEEDGDLIKVTFYSAPQSGSDTFSSTVPETVVTFTANKYDLRFARHGERVFIKRVEFNDIKGNYTQKKKIELSDAWMNALRTKKTDAEFVCYGWYIDYPRVDLLTEMTKEADLRPYYAFLYSEKDSFLAVTMRTDATYAETHSMKTPTEGQLKANEEIIAAFYQDGPGITSESITVLDPEIHNCIDAKEKCRSVASVLELNGWTKKLENACEKSGEDPQKAYYENSEMLYTDENSAQKLTFSKWGVLTFTWEDLTLAPEASLFTENADPGLTGAAYLEAAAQGFIRKCFPEKNNEGFWGAIKTEMTDDGVTTVSFFKKARNETDTLTASFPSVSVSLKTVQTPDGDKSFVCGFSIIEYKGKKEQLDAIPAEKAWTAAAAEKELDPDCAVYGWKIGYPPLSLGADEPDFTPYYTFLYSLPQSLEALTLTSPAVALPEVFTLPEPSEKQLELNRGTVESFEAAKNYTEIPEVIETRFTAILSYEEAKELCEKSMEVYTREGWAKKKALVISGDNPERIYYESAGRIYVEDLDVSLEQYGVPTGAVRPIITVENIGRIRLVWEYGDLSPKVSELCTVGDGKADKLSDEQVISVAENFLKKYFPDFAPDENEEFVVRPFDEDNEDRGVQVSCKGFWMWLTKKGFNNKLPEGENLAIYEVNLKNTPFRSYLLPVITLEEAWEKVKDNEGKFGELAVYAYDLIPAEKTESGIPQFEFLCSYTGGTETFSVTVDAVKVKDSVGYPVPG